MLQLLALHRDILLFNRLRYWTFIWFYWTR